MGLLIGDIVIDVWLYRAFCLDITFPEYYLIGRPIRISSIAYLNGKAQAPQLKVRYGYANTPIYPQLNTAQRAVEEPINVASLPSLIAKPSVVPGKEHQWHITYNQHGQPTKISELGCKGLRMLHQIANEILFT